MKKVYIVYSANENLMCNSYSVLGVVDSIEAGVRQLESNIEKQCKEDYKNNSYDNWKQMYNDAIYSLKTIQQTQCFNENYVIEEFTINQF